MYTQRKCGFCAHCTALLLVLRTWFHRGWCPQSPALPRTAPCTLACLLFLHCLPPRLFLIRFTTACALRGPPPPCSVRCCNTSAQCGGQGLEGASAGQCWAGGGGRCGSGLGPSRGWRAPELGSAGQDPLASTRQRSCWESVLISAGIRFGAGQPWPCSQMHLNPQTHPRPCTKAVSVDTKCCPASSPQAVPPVQVRPSAYKLHACVPW